MIFYNGQSGSLGRYFAEVARIRGVESTAIRSRLEDRDGFRNEISPYRGADATLVLFAAKVSVPACEADPEGARRTNVLDTLAMAETFAGVGREAGVRSRIVYISSAHLYSRNDGPIHETDPVLPRSVYARTKLEAEIALAALSERAGIDLRILRVFGLVAPVQPENYVLHALLKRAREKRLTGIPGLSNVRDYLDSRDVCSAIVDVIEVADAAYARVCPDRILNIASGEGVSIRALAELCVLAQYPRVEADTLLAEMTEAPPRADDVPRIVGSIDRFRALFGRNPKQIPLERTVRDALTSPERRNK